jgi:hypothetical protein
MGCFLFNGNLETLDYKTNLDLGEKLTFDCLFLRI